MNSQLQPVQQDTASLRLVASPWPESKGTFSRLRLRPEIARGLAGRVTQVADLCLLSLTLIYFALWAVEARPATDPLALLSMRISIAHFCVLAFCWMMWRAIFFYCGLYEWQHIRQVRSLSGRIVLASGICALAIARSSRRNGITGISCASCSIPGLRVRLVQRRRGQRSVYSISLSDRTSGERDSRSLWAPPGPRRAQAML